MCHSYPLARSSVTLFLSLSATCCETTAPSSPASLHGRFLLDSDSRIVVMDSDGTHRDTLPVVNAFGPAASPDGRQVAFSMLSVPSNQVDLYVIDADGGHLRQLTADVAEDQSPA